MPVFGIILVRIFHAFSGIRTRITPNTDTFYAVEFTITFLMSTNKVGLTKVMHPKLVYQYWKLVVSTSDYIKYSTQNLGCFEPFLKSNLWDGGWHQVDLLTPACFLVTLRKKWSFPSRISSVNVTKSVRNCRCGHICGGNL